MKELVIVSFFKALPAIVRWESTLYIVVTAVFAACVVLQIIMIRKEKPDWLLPFSFLAGEVCCEVFWQTIDGGDAQIFSVMGFVLIAGLLGCEICSIVRKLFQKLRRA